MAVRHAARIEPPRRTRYCRRYPSSALPKRPAREVSVMTSMSERVFVAALPLIGVWDWRPRSMRKAAARRLRARRCSRMCASSTARAGALSAPSNVLVKGNIIERISTAPIAAEPGVAVVAGGGRTLDARPDRRIIGMRCWSRTTPAQAFGDVGYNNLAGWRRSDGHSDARLHHRSRRGRAGVRSQAAPSTKASSRARASIRPAP